MGIQISSCIYTVKPKCAKSNTTSPRAQSHMSCRLGKTSSGSSIALELLHGRFAFTISSRLFARWYFEIVLFQYSFPPTAFKLYTRSDQTPLSPAVLIGRTACSCSTFCYALPSASRWTNMADLLLRSLISLGDTYHQRHSLRPNFVDGRTEPWRCLLQRQSRRPQHIYLNIQVHSGLVPLYTSCFFSIYTCQHGGRGSAVLPQDLRSFHILCCRLLALDGSDL